MALLGEEGLREVRGERRRGRGEVGGGLVGVEELAFVIGEAGVQGVTAVYAHFLHNGDGVVAEGYGRFGHTGASG
jgi:hypothetical protein